MRDALSRGDWDGVATQINLEWEARKKLAPGVTTPMIESLIAGAFAAGARAAKVCGAGGGGCLFCVADPDDVPAVQQALHVGRRPHPGLPHRDRRSSGSVRVDLCVCDLR